MTKITKRNEDGQIVEVELTSEQASEMAKKRWANKDRSLRLLTDRGYDTDNVDEGVKALSEIAVSGRSGAVQAQKYLDQISGFYQPNAKPTGGLAAPQPGEQCALCHQWNNADVDGEWASDMLRKLWEIDKQIEASEDAAAEVGAAELLLADVDAGEK